MKTANVDAAQVRKTANYLRKFVITCHEKAGLPLAPHEVLEPSSDLEALAKLCPGLPDRIGILVDAAEHLRLESSEIDLNRLLDELRQILRDGPEGGEIVRKCFDALFPLPKCIDRVERASSRGPVDSVWRAEVLDGLPEGYLSVEESAAFLGVSSTTIERRIADGLPFGRTDGREGKKIIRKSDLIAWVRGVHPRQET